MPLFPLPRPVTTRTRVPDHSVCVQRWVRTAAPFPSRTWERPTSAPALSACPPAAPCMPARPCTTRTAARRHMFLKDSIFLLYMVEARGLPLALALWSRAAA